MKKNNGIVISGIAAISAVVILGLAGCSTSAGIEATGKAAWDEQGARILEKNVVFYSIGLKWDLQILDLRSVLVGNIMKVQATLRSKDKDTLSFQYRFEWYDAGGLEINSGAGSWKPVMLNGSETKNIQAVAPDQRAKEFKLEIREPDK